jgi:dTMP kinase
MNGLLISFEGSEGCGKTTQIKLLAQRIEKQGASVLMVREPGGTPIGEEIRHTLKHSSNNHEMRAETELLLMNASRAQLVREVIRPALAAGKVVLCDRFYDSSVAYQGYGRGLELKHVESVISFAVGSTRPDLTLLFETTAAEIQQRLEVRQANTAPVRDRIEEADKAFFERVRIGFTAIAKLEPNRIKTVDASGTVEEVSKRVWNLVGPLLNK